MDGDGSPWRGSMRAENKGLARESFNIKPPVEILMLKSNAKTDKTRMSCANSKNIGIACWRVFSCHCPVEDI